MANQRTIHVDGYKIVTKRRYWKGNFLGFSAVITKGRYWRLDIPVINVLTRDEANWIAIEKYTAKVLGV